MSDNPAPVEAPQGAPTENTQTLPKGIPTPQQAPAQQPSNPTGLPSAPVPSPPGVVSTPAPNPVSSVVWDESAKPGIERLRSDPDNSVAVNYIETISKSTGLDVNRAFGKALAEGDARFIDQAYLSEKLGASAGDVQQLLTRSIDRQIAREQSTIGNIYGTVGGQANWEAAVVAFNKTAPADVRNVIKGLLNSPDPASVKYGAEQVVSYARQGGVVLDHKAQPLGAADSAVRGMTQEEYVKAISERNLSDAKYEELKQMRLIGKRRGL